MVRSWRPYCLDYLSVTPATSVPQEPLVQGSHFVFVNLWDIITLSLLSAHLYEWVLKRLFEWKLCTKILWIIFQSWNKSTSLSWRPEPNLSLPPRSCGTTKLTCVVTHLFLSSFKQQPPWHCGTEIHDKEIVNTKSAINFWEMEIAMRVPGVQCSKFKMGEWASAALFLDRDASVAAPKTHTRRRSPHCCLPPLLSALPLILKQE